MCVNKCSSTVPYVPLNSLPFLAALPKTLNFLNTQQERSNIDLTNTASAQENGKII